MIENDLVFLGEEESEIQEMNAEADLLYSKLYDVIEEAGGWVYRLKGEGEGQGYSYGDGLMSVDPTLSPVQRFRVLVHERAHDLLQHAKKPTRDQPLEETQADFIASVVCGNYGMDVSEDSAHYVVGYKGTLKLVRENRDLILNTAVQIINEIDAV